MGRQTEKRTRGLCGCLYYKLASGTTGLGGHDHAVARQFRQIRGG